MEWVNKSLYKRMKRHCTKVTGGILVGGFLLYSFSASAVLQPSFRSVLCGDAGNIEKHLKRSYSESPASIGVGGSVLYTLWLSEKGSFTITATHTEAAKTCVIAHGSEWKTIKEKGEEV